MRRVRALATRIAVVAIAVAIAGCPGPRAPAETGLPLYPEVIVAYAADDRGAYVVHVGAGGEAVRAELAARAGDDVVGEDGYVVRMSASERDAMAARGGVTAIEPLQPALRRAPTVGAGAREVRIDLFADASPDEAAAVAAWIAGRGGAVRWQGPTSFVATLPAGEIAAASRLSPVRWVE